MPAKAPVGLDAMRAALEARRGPEPKRKKKSKLVATAEQRQALKVLLAAAQKG